MNPPFHPWDDRRCLAILGDEKETLAFCTEHFLINYQKAITQKGFFTVALSGGSTPKILFSLLTHSPYIEQINWNAIHLFWSDERSVPPDHPDSNYHMAMQAGFSTVNIPPFQIHRMIAEKDIVREAALYEKTLRLLILDGSFDYLMLGMGEDGHTASLFPGTSALSIQDRLVAANYIPEKKTWRMTLTFTCINLAKQTVLYVLGDKKKELIYQIYMHKSPLYPVEQVGTKEHPALWILDQEAAALLPFKK